MMLGGHITARNYAAQASEALREWGRDVVHEVDKIGAELLANQIDEAVHFALPDSGRIFDDDLRGLDGAVLRLPYERVTLEYFVPAEIAKLTKEAPVHSPKRVIYLRSMARDKLVDLHNGYQQAASGAGIKDPVLSPIPDISGLIGDEFIYMATACYMRGRWHPMGATWVSQCESWQNKDFDRATSAFPSFPGNFSGGVGIHGRLGVLLPHFCNEIVKQARTTRHAVEILQHDINPEMRVMLEFLEAVACANIAHGVHQEAAKKSVNERRLKQGRKPINETKMLTIDLGYDGGKYAPRGSLLIGDRFSPREHLRRGHVRRLPRKEERIWIPPTVVNPGIESGKIDKQYRIKRG